MIAGKTGSGKSSLLHTLIVNIWSALCPDEKQFYLVDFKKGVEFKTYASHAIRLMPADHRHRERSRVRHQQLSSGWTAILKEARSELFRKVGGRISKVIAKPSRTKGCPRNPADHRRVPGILRRGRPAFAGGQPLARPTRPPGRAFGMLLGAFGFANFGRRYSLARSTLGQIGVRIAGLQCSESDAHLILSEENSAARLLTRPGEAIYNDSTA